MSARTILAGELPRYAARYAAMRPYAAEGGASSHKKI